VTPGLIRTVGRTTVTKYKIIAVVAVLLVCVAASVIPGPLAFSQVPLSRQVSAVLPITTLGAATLPNGAQITSHYIDLSTTDKALIISNLMLWGYPYEMYIHVEINNLVTRTIFHAKEAKLDTPIVIPPGASCRLLFYGLGSGNPAGWVSVTGYAVYPSEF